MHTHSQRSAPEAPDLFPLPCLSFLYSSSDLKYSHCWYQKHFSKQLVQEGWETCLYFPRTPHGIHLRVTHTHTQHTHTHTYTYTYTYTHTHSFLLEEGWGSLWTKVGYRFNFIDSDSFWFPVIEQTSTIFIEWGKILFDPLLILYVCPLTKKLSVYLFNGRFIWTVRDRITTNYY